MIELSCTKQLAALLPERMIEDPIETPLPFHWYAKTIRIYRRTALLACCAGSGFCVLLWGMKKKDYEKIHEYFREALYEILNLYGYDEDIIESYLPHDEPLRFTTGSNRSAFGELNALGVQLESAPEKYFDSDMLLQYKVTQWLNNGFSMEKDKLPLLPAERMDKVLSEYFGKPAISGGYHMRATLDLSAYAATREFIAPKMCAMNHLHDVLQFLYGWHDVHCHMFRGIIEVFAPIDLLKEMKEMGTEPEPIALIHGDEEYISLRRALEFNDCMKYLYDFGDGWEISLECLGEETSYTAKGVEMIACEGAAPPEDVGGVGGYLDFLEAWNDPAHSEHASVKEWAADWKPVCLSADQINQSKLLENLHRVRWLNRFPANNGFITEPEHD